MSNNFHLNSSQFLDFMHDAGALLSNLPAQSVIFQSNDPQSWRLWLRLSSYSHHLFYVGQLKVLLPASPHSLVGKRIIDKIAFLVILIILG